MSDELEKRHERFEAALKNVGKAIAPEGTWHRRALDAEARVAELEESFATMLGQRNRQFERAEKAEARVPDGHVAVMLQREDVERWADKERGWTWRMLNAFCAACRKALEADDA